MRRLDLYYHALISSLSIKVLIYESATGILIRLILEKLMKVRYDLSSYYLKFYRNFPGPPDITDAEKCALACRYSIPSHPGKVDYRRFETDISKLNVAEETAKRGSQDKVLCGRFVFYCIRDIYRK